MLLLGLVPGHPPGRVAHDPGSRRGRPAVCGRDRPDAARPGPPERVRGPVPAGQRPGRAGGPRLAPVAHRRPAGHARRTVPAARRRRLGPRSAFTVDALAALADRPEPDVRRLLDGLVAREVLVLDDDPRSPERGQYRFIQGVLREVAYSRLSRRDRLARHLAAAEYFETAAGTSCRDRGKPLPGRPGQRPGRCRSVGALDTGQDGARGGGDQVHRDRRSRQRGQLPRGRRRARGRRCRSEPLARDALHRPGCRRPRERV